MTRHDPRRDEVRERIARRKPYHTVARTGAPRPHEVSVRYYGSFGCIPRGDGYSDWYFDTAEARDAFESHHETWRSA